MHTYYTTEEAAAYLKLKSETITRFIRDGRIKAVKWGKRWRISEEALRAFVNNGQEKNNE